MRKLSKKLLLSVLSVALVFIALGTTTFAWFSMNQDVTAKGMQVKAVASDSLVISNELAVGTAINVNFSTAVSELIPATHSATYISEAGASAQNTTTNLKYVNNPQVVNASTGLEESGQTLYFGDAVNDTANSKYYYVDYTCYIASAGQAMENTDLEVYLYRNLALEKDTTRAVSVDFYFATNATTGTGLAALGSYAGTLDLSNLTKNAAGEWASTKLTLDVNTVPVNNQSTTYLKITMRVYFDGALAATRYNKTTDTTVDTSKTYYTFSTTDGFVQVETPSDGSLNTYYEAQANSVLVYTDAASTDAVDFNAHFSVK